MSLTFTVRDWELHLRRESHRKASIDEGSSFYDLDTACSYVASGVDFQDNIDATRELDSHLVGRHTDWYESMHDTKYGSSEDGWGIHGEFRRFPYAGCLSTLKHWTVIKKTKNASSCANQLSRMADRQAINEPFAIGNVDPSIFKKCFNLKLTRIQAESCERLVAQARAAGTVVPTVHETFKDLNHFSEDEPRIEVSLPELKLLVPRKSGFLESVNVYSDPRQKVMYGGDLKKWFNIDNKEQQPKFQSRTGNDVEVLKQAFASDESVIEEPLSSRFVPRQTDNPRKYFHTSDDSYRMAVERLPHNLFTSKSLSFTSFEKQDLTKSIQPYALKELDCSLPIIKYTFESASIQEILKNIKEEKPTTQEWIHERATKFINQARDLAKSLQPICTGSWKKAFPDMFELPKRPRLPIASSGILHIWHSGFVNPKWILNSSPPPITIASPSHYVLVAPETGKKDIKISQWKTRETKLSYEIIDEQSESSNIDAPEQSWVSHNVQTDLSSTVPSSSPPDRRRGSVSSDRDQLESAPTSPAGPSQHGVMQPIDNKSVPIMEKRPIDDDETSKDPKRPRREGSPDDIFSD